MKSIRLLVVRLAVAVVALLPVAVATAAPPVTAVSMARHQLDGGDAAGALQMLDGYLKDAPDDAAARFLRGLALVRLGRRDDAIEAFRSLTHAFPKLPEPYNNLAVLYAEQGNLELARTTLETVLSQQPDYAPAHENLGDVYAALAAKAYRHAVALDPADDSARRKLAIVGQVGSGVAPAAP